MEIKKVTVVTDVTRDMKTRKTFHVISTPGTDSEDGIDEGGTEPPPPPCGHPGNNPPPGGGGGGGGGSNDTGNDAHPGDTPFPPDHPGNSGGHPGDTPTPPCTPI